MSVTNEMRDEAVRNYLIYLDDPSKLRNDTAIKTKEKELKAATDVLIQLRLHDELTALRDIPEESFRRPFVDHALKYAETHGVSIAGFEGLGVSRTILREAGFEVRYPNKGVTIQEIVAKIEGSDWAEFTKPILMEATGSSPATISKAINQMIETGLVKRTDRTSDMSTGRGARAKLYEIIR